MYNIFYKIENQLNGKFYYGVHKTDNPDDNYMGSGKRIGSAIKKYGKENFIKTNQLFFNSYEETLDYEEDFVNEDLLLDPSCYNIKKGGKGGSFKGINKGKTISQKQILQIKEKLSGRKLSDEHKQKLRKSLTTEHRKNISLGQLGKKKNHFKIINRKKYTKVLCEHCGKEIIPQMYSRWHGKKCKYNND